MNDLTITWWSFTYGMAKCYLAICVFCNDLGFCYWNIKNNRLLWSALSFCNIKYRHMAQCFMHQVNLTKISDIDVTETPLLIWHHDLSTRSATEVQKCHMWVMPRAYNGTRKCKSMWWNIAIVTGICISSATAECMPSWQRFAQLQIGMSLNKLQFSCNADIVHVLNAAAFLVNKLQQQNVPMIPRRRFLLEVDIVVPFFLCWQSWVVTYRCRGGECFVLLWSLTWNEKK